MLYLAVDNIIQHLLAIEIDLNFMNLNQNFILKRSNLPTAVSKTLSVTDTALGIAIFQNYFVYMCYRTLI